MNYSINPGMVALALIVAVIALSLWRVQRSQAIDFDLLDLLMENGRVSKAACVMMGAFALTTWMMVFMTLSGKMTEGYFTAYGAMWIAPVVARLIFHKPEAKP